MHSELLALSLAVAFALVAARGSQSFRRLKESPPEKKVRIYRSWLAISFLCFGVAGSCLIYNFERTNTSIYLPYQIAFRVVHENTSIDPSQLVPMLFGFCIGLIAIVFVARTRRGRKFYNTEAVSALRPDTQSEKTYLVLLCVNAAISEEIMFRGALPVLIYTISENAMTAILVAALAFGCMHCYQGARGILSTFCLAILFSILLGVGFNLYVVMLLHFFINMMALFVLPKISRLGRPKETGMV